MSKSALVLPLVLAALSSPAPDEESASLYPAKPAETRVHFFALDGEPDMGKMRDALDELGDGAEIVFGPQSSNARPSISFVVVEAPAGVDAKEVAKALKKGKAKPEPLQWMLTSFAMPDLSSLGGGREVGGGGGGGPEGLARGLVLGQHGDLRWFEIAKEHALFFWTGNKLDAAEILDRVHKGLEPYVPAGGLPAIVRDEFTWSLAAGFKPGSLDKAERELSKLPGVAELAVDEQLGTITVRVDLADQLTSAAPGPWPAPAEPAAPEGGDPGGEAPGGGEPGGGDDPGGGGRGGGGPGGGAGKSNWFDEHRLVFDRNLALDVLAELDLHAADPAEGAER